MRFTVLLCALITAVFLYTALAAPDPAAFYERYGFSGPNAVARPYTAVTALFLHAGLEHLLANLVMLLIFGIAVEKELGPLRMLGIFVLGGLAGDLASLLAYPFDTLSVGASAGIFALIGVGMLVKPLDLSFYPLVLPVPLLLLGMGYALYNAYGLFFLAGDGISYAGHFGGLAIGLPIGCAKTGFRKGVRTMLIGLSIVAALVAAWKIFG